MAGLAMSNFRIRSAAAGSAALLLTACDDIEEPDAGSDAAAESQEQEAEPASDTGEEASEDAQEEDAETSEEEPSAEAGTRDNPLPLGETFEHADWSVTVNSFTGNADAQVAAENQFNDPAREGSMYALINADATSHGEESEMVMMGVSIDFATSSGETIGSADSMAVAPDGLDLSAELFEGGTESGNVILAVPEEAEGPLRVSLGMFDQEDAFFSPNRSGSHWRTQMKRAPAIRRARHDRGGFRGCPRRDSNP